MKVTYQKRKGGKKWEVDLGTVAGRRQRKYFETRAQAEGFLKAKQRERENLGIQALTLTHDARAEYQACLQKLDGRATLLETVQFYLRYHKELQPKPLGQVIDACLLEKRSAGKRHRYLQVLTSTLKAFRLGREDRLCHDITVDEIREWLNGNGWTTATRRSRLIDLRTVFEWAKAQRHCLDNPATSIEMPHPEQTPPRSLGIEALTQLLSRSVLNDPQLAGGYIAPILFGGLRESEALKLTSTDVQDLAICVEANKAKTRRRRIIEIGPQLKQWLKLCPEWPLRNVKKRLDKICHDMEWPKNCLRHSFCSYGIHILGAQKTAEMAGHSEQMLFNRYRALVPKAEAEKWAALTPAALGNQKA